MDNKGFSLIELLAVIVLLGIIALVSVVSITNIMNKSKNKLTDIQIKHVIDASKLYNLEEGVNRIFFDREVPQTCVNVETLSKNGYIEKKVINPKNKKQMIGSVKIKYIDNDYTYEYQESDCNLANLGYICRKVNSNEVTTGNEPVNDTSGNRIFNIGDEYLCDVNDENTFRFFVFGFNANDSNKINMIMEQNIGISSGDLAIDSTNDWRSSWHSTNGEFHYTHGPTVAQKNVELSTSKWDNLENLNEVYDVSDNKWLTKYNITGKARLPYLYELQNIGCTENYGQCPLWAVNYLYKNDYYSESDGKVNNTITGYWTFSTNKPDYRKAYYINFRGNYDIKWVENSEGIRPVISVSKKYIL